MHQAGGVPIMLHSCYVNTHIHFAGTDHSTNPLGDTVIMSLKLPALQKYSGCHPILPNIGFLAVW